MKKPRADAKKATYQPTASERAAIGRHTARRETKTPAPRLKVLHSGTRTEISLDHPSETIASALLKEALGTADNDFIEGLIRQISDSDGKPDEGKLNFMLAVIKDIKPNDQLETMLAAQMAAVHVTFMKFARHFDRIESLPQQDSAKPHGGRKQRSIPSRSPARSG